ncbi:glycoside hydrolase family 10 [Opitutaceae bacterium TAV4]|nr:glycoside hydrolase family 10 [Opitutaceae bacterium TAV4]RRJ98460.1 glycoside hydrolase family 10 [Opitutaceae bacterium TAV3]
MNTNTLVSTEYQKFWSDPGLQSRIDEGIRRNRQSDAVIRTMDFTGKPMPGVKVRVSQHDSPFHFGANLFKLDGYPLDELNRKYEEAFCALFNGATIPFYWRTLEPEQGRPRFGIHSVPIARRPPPDKTVKFCEERGLRMHGHTLVWNFRKWSVPDWLPEEPDKAAPLWEKRIAEIATRYGDRIKRWDVLNEPVAFYDRTPRGIRMQDDYEGKSFDWAATHFPSDVRFDVNEITPAWTPDEIDGWTNKMGDLTHLLERLRSTKRRVGGIGLQFHFFSDTDLAKVLAGQIYTPKILLNALDHYARFELPLHVSEITLTSPGNSPEGLEAQAIVARNFYRLWFSHPTVDSITWWNLPDGGAAPGENKVYSGLLFEDMRPKPSYRVLQNLIRHEWRTQAEGITDADGCFRFRGFHGSYVIRTESGNVDSGIQSSITLEAGKTAEQRIHL